MENTPLIAIPSIELKPAVSLFDSLPRSTRAIHPVHMEALGQALGFILYRHKVRSAVGGILKTGDTPRDRVLVYVNGKRTGVIDSIYPHPTLNLKPGDVLDTLIENLGRVNYGSEIPNQRKGIVGDVTVGSTVLLDWEHFPLTLEKPPSAHALLLILRTQPLQGQSSTKAHSMLRVPVIPSSNFLENGVILGRYWTVGPQQQLYLPGVYLKKRNNEITVLALEPNANQSPAKGIQVRSWSNNPDPDAP
ncbi:hypothetical protein VE02_02741 [Pseudogymnoascus sp. 03VT05]|nr:hypothetical protein VE02_02741 [Pseudogymnoascus sp. 03VT05]